VSESPTRASELLDRGEIRAFTERSNLAGARAILVTWGTIAAALALAARWPGVLTFTVAVIVIGGRQLALAVLMHEAAHRTLFRSRWLNDTLADWLCARPVWTDVARYREHHLAHHAHAGTERDPDGSLVEPFPTSRRSLVRKLLRDLAGVTGLKRVVGLALMDAERIAYNVSGDVRWLPRRALFWHIGKLARNAAPALVTNLVLFATLWALSAAWVYAVWGIAWLTTYGLFLRIRSIAEHACTEGGPDPLRHTRTTHASWLARMTVAPHQVAYHLEHHLLPTVPYFRLAAMHRRLKALGAIPQSALATSYVEVLRQACILRPHG
jgi:fatty acid desaturase